MKFIRLVSAISLILSARPIKHHNRTVKSQMGNHSKFYGKISQFGLVDLILGTQSSEISLGTNAPESLPITKLNQ